MEKQAHKEELHQRITERRGMLVETRTRLGADAHTKDGAQFRAVDDALAMIDTHLKVGWENVGEGEAAELSRWLESTRFLPQPALAHAETQPVVESKPATPIPTA